MPRLHGGTCERPARGPITLILGCMFSGKTTELLRIISGWPAGERLVLKHGIDSRYAPHAVVTHGRRSHPAIAVREPADVLAQTGPHHRHVAIDEAHFFPIDLVDAVKQLRDRRVDVVLTALDRNSWGRPFAVIERLRALASNVREMTTLCARCGAIADRTQRLTRITDRSMVGGPESYEPRCQDCWCPPPEQPLD